MVRIEKQHQARRDSLTHTSRSSDWQLPKCSLYGSCAWGRGLVVIRQCSLAVIARDGWRGDRSSIDIRQWQYKMVVFTSFITCVLSSLYSMRSFNNLYLCLNNYVVVLLLVRVFFVFFVFSFFLFDSLQALFHPFNSSFAPCLLQHFNSSFASCLLQHFNSSFVCCIYFFDEIVCSSTLSISNSFFSNKLFIT